jgi:GNAT superfamily N-acetyltransferase
MKTTHRNYDTDSGDFHRISRFLIENNAFMRSHSTWCLCRFVDWKYSLWGKKLAVPDFWKENAHLWFDAFGDLAAFAISEEGGADFVILTAAGYRFLFKEILGWVLENWGDRNGLTIEISAQQALEASILECNGFQREASFYTFQYDLNGELAERFPLEQGFSIVDMHTCPDYRAQRIMRAEAFDGKAELSEEEIEYQLRFYNNSHNGPLYYPQTDLCVMAPDGTFVSGCEALIDARNAEADIERVCTHSQYRRRGFARAVIQECIFRLRDMGMRYASITGYSPGAIALYGSFGDAERAELLIYKRGTVS